MQNACITMKLLEYNIGENLEPKKKKQPRMAILIETIDFKINKCYSIVKEGHVMITKGSVYLKDMTGLIIYTFNNRTTKYTKQN